MRLLPLLALVACESLPPTGNPLAPVPVSQRASPSSVAPGPGPVSDGGFDFDQDAAPDEDPSAGVLDPTALLALSQGKEPPALLPPRPTAAPVPSVTIAPVPSGPAAPPVWTPGSEMPADWGVRLVSTLVETQPPRAVLGLPDGSEVVVKPGAFLPDLNLVVMAVGRDVVQVSRVTPNGYQARVETHTLSSLYPSGSVLRPR